MTSYPAIPAAQRYPLHVAPAPERHFVFIGGLHRSGTSLLNQILRAHPDISGFEGTGVNADEGQHLQSVYKPAKAFGGTGKFGFNKKAFMNERHPLATRENGDTLMREWSVYWDLSKPYLLEKSPPNIIRTRFLQALFPNAKFIIIFRHPLAVAYATSQYTKLPIPLLYEHNLRCYERLLDDLPHLGNAYLIRYEDFVRTPRDSTHALLSWLGTTPFDYHNDVRTNINDKYFARYRSDRQNLWTRLPFETAKLLRHYEARSNRLGYSLDAPDTRLDAPFYGAHSRSR